MKVTLYPCQVEELKLVGGPDFNTSTRLSGFDEGFLRYQFQAGEDTWLMKFFNIDISQTPRCNRRMKNRVSFLELQGSEVIAAHLGVVPPICFFEKDISLFGCQTILNADTGVYSFMVEQEVDSKYQIEDIKLNVFNFSVEVLPRPVFPPTFDLPINETLYGKINTETVYCLPTYTFYDFEAGDTVKTSVRAISSEGKTGNAGNQIF